MNGRVDPDGAAEALTQADYESLAAFRFALRRFMHFSTQAAQDAGLTTSQHQALLSIKGFPGARAMIVGELAEHLVVAPHTAAALVSRLEQNGLVRKVGDATDGRRVGLEITRKAEKLLERLTDTHLQEVRVVAPNLIGTLLRLLPNKASTTPRKASPRAGRSD